MGFFSKEKETEEIVDVYKNDVFRNYKRRLHLYIVEGNKSFIRLNSFDASENKSLFDAPIIKDIPVNKTYFKVFLDTYREYTGKTYKQVNNYEKEVIEPRVHVDTKKKIITYILFLKNPDKIETSILPQVKFVYDWLPIEEFLKVICSKKFVNYGEEYRDFVIYGVSELLDVEEVIKKQKYTANQED